MAFRFVSSVAIVAIALAAPIPAPAQFMSGSYEFFKAIKAGDYNKAMGMVSEPGTVLINSREGGTGETALHFMTRHREIGWLGYLISKGAKPDIQNRDGMTPLALAAQIGWQEGAERLLKGRAQVDLPNKLGETPLILAVQARNSDMARLLLSKGADPRRTDSISGSSALDYARKDGRAPALVKLLEAPKARGPMVGPKL